MIDPTVAQQLEMLNRTGALAAAFLAGWVCCLISLWTGLRAMRRIRQHRLASRMGPPKGIYLGRLDSAALQQGNGSWVPLHGRVVDACGRTVGYIPRPQGGTPNPPPSDP